MTRFTESEGIHRETHLAVTKNMTGRLTGFGPGNFSLKMAF